MAKVTKTSKNTTETVLSVEETTKMLNEEYEAGYVAGLETGATEEYDDGFDAGYDTGYGEGHDAGEMSGAEYAFWFLHGFFYEMTEGYVATLDAVEAVL